MATNGDLGGHFLLAFGSHGITGFGSIGTGNLLPMRGVLGRQGFSGVLTQGLLGRESRLFGEKPIGGGTPSRGSCRGGWPTPGKGSRWTGLYILEAILEVQQIGLHLDVHEKVHWGEHVPMVAGSVPETGHIKFT